MTVAGRIEIPGESWRYEVRSEVSPEEVRVIELAVAEYLRSTSRRPAAWAVTGRGDAYGLGSSELRHQLAGPWGHVARHPFALREMLDRHGPDDLR